MIFQGTILLPAIVFFLGRDPESERVIEEKQTSVKTVEDLINCFSHSEEYIARNFEHYTGNLVLGNDSYLLKKYTDGRALKTFRG